MFPVISPGKRKTRSRSALTLLVMLTTAGCSAPQHINESSTSHTAAVPGETVHLPAFAKYGDSAEATCRNPDYQTLSAVVRIATDNGSNGSGVVVARDRVLTAAHVLEEAHLTRVGFDGSFHQAELVAVDPANDLALLAVATGEREPVRISHHELLDAEHVWAIGFPLAREQAISHGEYQRSANGKIYTSAWITAGNSGGGLMRCKNGSYELAGILRDYVAYLRDGMYINADQSTSAPAAAIRRIVEDNNRPL